jgi:LmbE family N-acetylglucosaminyl deacetylase
LCNGFRQSTIIFVGSLSKAEAMAGDKLEPLPLDWQRALAVAAHPDDLEYGASSAIASWTAAGKAVAYVLASRGEAGLDTMRPADAAPLREAEERESARLVGVDDVQFLGFPDGTIEYGLPLRRALSREIRRWRPEVIVTPSFDLSWPSGPLNQADHRAVGLAVCDAARDAGNRWIFPDLLDDGAEPWGGVRSVFVQAPVRPTHAREVTEADLQRGIASLQAQRLYFEILKQAFDPEKFLREQAQRTGASLGVHYGIAFDVLPL